MNLDKNIGWCTHTHNAMTGCRNLELKICNIGACYARQVAENPHFSKAFPYGFKPHFYPERLIELVRAHNSRIIFMDSMSDTFGSWWTEEEIVQVLDNALSAAWHKYIFLTKNSRRMWDILERVFINSKNSMQHIYFGTSVSGLEQESERIAHLAILHELGFKTVLSAEPLLFNPEKLLNEKNQYLVGAKGITWLDWLIVGGQTKPTKIPPHEWVNAFVKEVAPASPIFLKDNAGIQFTLGWYDDKLGWWTSPDPSRFTPYPRFPMDLLPIAKAWGKA